MLYWGGRMEFLLNERSLHGQFESTDDFLKSLKPVMNCINIIRAYSDMEIYKIRKCYKGIFMLFFKNISALNRIICFQWK